MSCRFAFLALVLFSTMRTAPAQVRDVLELGHAGEAVLEIRVDWGKSLGFRPKFLGDVDGDGFDDFLVRHRDRDDVLVYGAPQDSFASPLRIEDTRHSTFVGNDEIHTSRSSFAGLGDVDSDGYDDFLLASPRTPWGDQPGAGVVLLIFGAADLSEQVPLGGLEESGVRSLRFISREELRYAGQFVSSAGDLNGDGHVDVAIRASAGGSENGGVGAGRVYVVFGGFDFSEDVFLDEVGRGVAGFVMHGAYGKQRVGELHDNLGCCVQAICPAGDLNGDGLDDLLVTASRAPRNNGESTGAVYVVYGAPDLSGDLYVTEPETFGVEFAADNPPQGIERVAAAGDVDGDGLDDFIVGVLLQEAALIVYGARDWPARLRISEARVTRVFGDLRVLGANVGTAVAGIGDWNRDGFADVAIGSPKQTVRFQRNTGAVHLLFGGPNLVDTPTSEIGTNLAPGIAIFGSEASDHAGRQLEAGGDFDGDGIDDFLLVAPFQGGTAPLLDEVERSSIYVIFGDTDDGQSFGLTAIVPDEGAVEGGYEVSIRGQGLQAVEQVLFDGIPVSSLNVRSSAELAVVVPPGEALGAVSVTISSPTETIALEQAFVYTGASLFPDFALDPGQLRADGRRALVISDFIQPARSRMIRQFANVFFHDLNGDGLDDLVIGSPSDGPEGNGRVSIVFGHRDLPDEILRGDIEEDSGTVIDMGPLTSYSGLGASVAFPGDIDENGRGDLVIGGPLEQPYVGRELSRGRFYVVFDDDWPSKIVLEDAVQDGTALAIDNETCGEPRVSSSGNMRHREATDLIVGYFGCDGDQGEVKLFLDGIAREHEGVAIKGDPTPVTGSDRVLLGTRFPTRTFGETVSPGGDLNGDGWLDYIVGAGHGVGACYFILGGADGFPPESSILELIENGRAVLIEREELIGNFGKFVAPAGDFNGDGIDDALLGAPTAGRSNEGEAYVVYGSKEFGRSIRRISVLTDRSLRMRIIGEFSDDRSGYVSYVGDINRDGFSDIGITGDNINVLGDLQGQAKAYIVFGGPEPLENLELARLGRRGFKITGMEGHVFSAWRGGIAAGDLNGDGAVDLALGEATATQERRVVVVFGTVPTAQVFIRGDANDDGNLNLGDALFVLLFLFGGGASPKCQDSADVDDDGNIGITDAVLILNHLFVGSPLALPPPYPSRGEDPTPDALGCLR